VRSKIDLRFMMDEVRIYGLPQALGR